MESCKRGATSVMFTVFIQDSTSTKGAGLTGLTNASTNLQISMRRELSSSVTTYTGANIEAQTTIGTYQAPSSSSKIRFKAVDGTNQPGVYEIQVHDSATNGFGTGDASRYVDISIFEITTTALNIAQSAKKIQLEAVDRQSASAFITGINSLTPPANWNLDSIDSNGRRDIVKVAGTTQTARDLGAQLDAAISTRASATDYTATRAGKLDNLDATVSSRNATTPPTVGAIRTEMDDNSTKLARLDVTVSSRPAASDYTSGRAAKLDNLDVAVSTRGDATASNQTTIITGVAAVLSAISGVPAAVWAAGGRTLSSFGTLVADIVTALAGYFTPLATSTNVTDAQTTILDAIGDIPTSPTVGEIRTELDDNSTKLANLDAAISTRSTPAQITSAADAIVAAMPTPEQIMLAIYKRKITYDSGAGQFVIWNDAGDTELGRVTPTTDAGALPIIGMEPV